MSKVRTLTEEHDAELIKQLRMRSSITNLLTAHAMVQTVGNILYKDDEICIKAVDIARDILSLARLLKSKDTLETRMVDGVERVLRKEKV